MSYELLLKETDALTYAEQINLMAYLATSIQKKSKEFEKNKTQEKIKALDTLATLFTPEEIQAVDNSIKEGVKIGDVLLWHIF